MALRTPMKNKNLAIVFLLMFSVIISACGQTPAAPTEAPAATEANTGAPATATIEAATATSEPVDLTISPETLSQVRLLWNVNYPGDFESSSCLTIERACPLTTNITDYAFSPDGDTLAVGVCLGMRTEDRTRSGDVYGCTAEHAIVLYDSKTGEERGWLIPASLALSLAYHPDGSILAAGLANGDIELWDVSSSELSSTLTVGGNPAGVYRVGFTPDGNTLVSGANFQLQLWDWQAAEPLSLIDRVYGFGISPDSKSLVTFVFGDTETVRVYDLADVNSSVEVALEGQFRPTVFHFNPRSGMMASAGMGIDAYLVNFWDLANRELVGSMAFDEVFDETGILYNLDSGGFTPDGYFLFTRSGELSAAEAQPDSTDLSEPLWECGFALLDVEANQVFTHSEPMMYSECEGPEYMYLIFGSKSQRLSPDGRFIVGEDGLGLLRVWGIDASLPAVPPACLGDC
jgi:WD40 repeat protein